MDSTQMAVALRNVVSAVLEACKGGAPAGVVYAALMTQGCSKSQFDSLIGALVSCGKLRRDGHTLTSV